MTDKQWATIIADLRLHAFHVAYRRMYVNVEDPTLRFGYALAYSVRPIPDSPQVNRLLLAWWQKWKKQVYKQQWNSRQTRQETDDEYETTGEL